MTDTFAQSVLVDREDHILKFLAEGPANSVVLSERLGLAGHAVVSAEVVRILCDLEVRGAVVLQRVGGVTVAELRGSKDASLATTSDARTINNVMRHAYRVLSDEEKAHMQALKDDGLAFVELLHRIGGTDAAGDRQASRELSTAQTKIEEAVMWAVKHVTR